MQRQFHLLVCECLTTQFRLLLASGWELQFATKSNAYAFCCKEVGQLRNHGLTCTSSWWWSIWQNSLITLFAAPWYEQRFLLAWSHLDCTKPMEPPLPDGVTRISWSREGSQSGMPHVSTPYSSPIGGDMWMWHVQQLHTHAEEEKGKKYLQLNWILLPACCRGNCRCSWFTFHVHFEGAWLSLQEGQRRGSLFCVFEAENSNCS